eukprot:COSAG06_NODE_2102_length_7592_cov_14.509676_8_plen_427_part_00
MCLKGYMYDTWPGWQHLVRYRQHQSADPSGPFVPIDGGLRCAHSRSPGSLPTLQAHTPRDDTRHAAARVAMPPPRGLALRRPLTLAALATASTTAVVRSEWVGIPSTTLSGDADSCTHCNNLQGSSVLGEMYRGKPCGETDEQRAKCVADASAACEAEPKCYAFIVPMVGLSGKDLGWCLYEAGLGNAAPNEDWALYSQRDFPCTACSNGQPVANPVHQARYAGGGGGDYAFHCVDDSLKLYCASPADWGMEFLLLAAVLGAAYVGGGIVLGSKQGAGGAGAKAHPHYSRWVEVHGLVQDGVAFVRGGGGGSGSSRTSGVVARRRQLAPARHRCWRRRTTPVEDAQPRAAARARRQATGAAVGAAARKMAKERNEQRWLRRGRHYLRQQRPRHRRQHPAVLGVKIKQQRGTEGGGSMCRDEFETCL